MNIYQQRESIGAAFRVIPYEIKPLEALGVPPVVGSFAGLPRGLVLVTGPDRLGQVDDARRRSSTWPTGRARTTS